MNTLSVTLKTVTPLFLGGADPNVRAELRPPSIKGALRFWYRAIDPAYEHHERRIFGSTDKGQSSFLVRLGGVMGGNECFLREKYEKEFTENRGKPDVKNGMIYLGYSLNLGGNDRKALPAGQIITAGSLFRKFPDEHTRKAILSAWWLLGHLGGVGTRSRRGFGTLAIHSWKISVGKEWPEIESLPVAHGAGTREEWLDRFKAGLDILRRWYPGSRVIDHTVLGVSTWFYLFTAESESSGVLEGWERALNAAGRAMQDFRQRKLPDYEKVKNHLAMREMQRRKERDPTATLPKLPPVTPAWLASPPGRIAFGLPLAFRYGSLEKAGYNNRGTSFQGKDHDRNASPVHIRIVEIGQRCYAFYAFLDAPFLARGELVKEQADKAGMRAKAPPSSTILDDFRQDISKVATEVRW